MTSRENVIEAVHAFAHTELSLAAMNLWAALGYQSEKQLDISSDPEAFCLGIEGIMPINRVNAHVSEWQAVHFSFQLTNDEIPSLSYGQLALIVGENDYQKGAIESFVFLAIELADGDWTRTQLAKITRELNRAFPMPAIVLFKHNAQFSIAVIDRRANKRDANKDVIDTRRIAIIKDVVFAKPHRAHIEILHDLAFPNLGEKHAPSNFRELYEAWIKTLSVQELNKKFYDELLTWYLWAVKQTTFPKGQPLDREKQPSVAVIRLLTRLIFIWFIREKNLVPDALFDAAELNALLKEPPAKYPDSSSYYKAILQNLFFATLNTDMKDRQWKIAGKKGFNNDYLNSYVYRYQDQMRNPERAFNLFKNIPFLNGGLFECLDRPLEPRELERNPDIKNFVLTEGNGSVLRIDGFSDRTDNTLHIPNRLFFSVGEEVDLNQELGTKNKKRTARGLIEIFSRYKFTIEENTPIEEEVALDPELLGKVFENLLASYNEDTKTTARKQSGSFYTPREVVDYMVDESLKTYFTSRLQSQCESENLEARLNQMLAFGTQATDFTETEVEVITSAIEDLKALDLACGSGAFLIGMLQKLVHVLSKLDPDNRHWKAQNRAPLERQLAEAEAIPDPMLQDTKIEEARDALAKLDQVFSERHYADYSRKLYLIQKCLFGVDIQPIAIQIAKLRFFIALIVSQKVDRDAENANITALPNLDTKLVAANSLIYFDRDGLPDDHIVAKEEELRLANKRHFAARQYRTKKRSQEHIVALRHELTVLLEEGHMLTEDSVKKFVLWNPFDQNASAGFFDREWMFGLTEGFDIVIGNPPYVRHEGIQDQKPDLKKIYTCYTGTADLYVYFYERSIRLLKPYGAFAFITSNRWYRSNYGKELRQWMNQNTFLRRIIDFGDAPVFDAMAYPTIVIAQRRPKVVTEPGEEEIVLALNWDTNMPVETFPEVFAEHAFPVPQRELKVTGWQIEKPYKREILTKMKAAGTPLFIWCNRKIYAGIKTGLNEAFIVDGPAKDAMLRDHPDSAPLFVPCLRGRDVKRWHVKEEDYWLIKIESSENVPHPWSGLPELEAWQNFAALHPSVALHFEQLMPGLQDRLDQGTYYWELRSCGFWPEFAEPKVFMPAIEKAAMYAPITGEYYGNNKTHFVVTDEWDFLSAVLNSEVSWWFTQQVFTTKQGGYYEFIPQFVGQIPIPPADENQKALIRTIVKILLVSPDNVASWEQLLNGLVYELYFPDDLHSNGIRLFDELERLNILSKDNTQSVASVEAGRAIAQMISSNDHPVYRMLFDLQGLEIVRIIEGKV